MIVSFPEMCTTAILSRNKKTKGAVNCVHQCWKYLTTTFNFSEERVYLLSLTFFIYFHWHKWKKICCINKMSVIIDVKQDGKLRLLNIHVCSTYLSNFSVFQIYQIGQCYLIYQNDQFYQIYQVYHICKGIRQAAAPKNISIIMRLPQYILLYDWGELKDFSIFCLKIFFYMIENFLLYGWEMKNFSIFCLKIFFYVIEKW